MICRTCLIMQFILAFMNIWWYVYNLGFPLCWKLHVKIMQARKIHFSVFVKSAILFLVNLKNSNQSKNTNGSYMSFSACLWWLIPCRCTKEVWRTTSIIFTTYRTLLAAIFRNQESWWSWVIGVTQLRQDGEAFFILCFNLNW